MELILFAKQIGSGLVVIYLLGYGVEIGYVFDFLILAYARSISLQGTLNIVDLCYSRFHFN